MEAEGRVHLQISESLLLLGDADAVQNSDYDTAEKDATQDRDEEGGNEPRDQIINGLRVLDVAGFH